jgi:hypothetical protein
VSKVKAREVERSPMACQFYYGPRFVSILYRGFIEKDDMRQRESVMVDKRSNTWFEYNKPDP